MKAGSTLVTLTALAGTAAADRSPQAELTHTMVTVDGGLGYQIGGDRTSGFNPFTATVGASAGLASGMLAFVGRIAASKVERNHEGQSGPMPLFYVGAAAQLTAPNGFWVSAGAGAAFTLLHVGPAVEVRAGFAIDAHLSLGASLLIVDESGVAANIEPMLLLVQLGYRL